MSVTVKVADNSAQKNKIKDIQVSMMICEFIPVSTDQNRQNSKIVPKSLNRVKWIINF